MDSVKVSSRSWIAELKEFGITVDTSKRRLAEYSYDASNYRIPPLGIVFPRSAQEIVMVMKVCHQHQIPVTSRGGGTSMAGNAVGRGLVLDLSRHLNKVLRIDLISKQATAEVGIVLETLQSTIENETHNQLTFAPDPSSKSRATLGGAIANDACGNHSVRYGRTSAHLVALNLVTADGVQITATNTGIEPTFPNDDSAASRAAELTSALCSLVEANAQDIRLELDRIPRQVSGFQLAHLLPEQGFDVARSLAGSEGTCAVIVSATVQLVPTPSASMLLALGYSDVIQAAEDVPTILEFGPAAIEGMDRAIVETMRRIRGPESVQGLPDGSAWLYVDLDGEDASDIETKASQLMSRLALNGRLVGGRVITKASERLSLWRVREDGAGLSSRLASGAESWPGWEDSAVDPERLANYLADLSKLLDKFHLVGIMYGHFGAGCMHIRINFDMRTNTGRRIMTDFTHAAAELVISYGGSLSGEHGDGRARSSLLPIMYTPSIMNAFDNFKHLWDPAGILNPAVLTNPEPIDSHLALDGVPGRRWETNYVLDGETSSASQHETDPFIRSVQRCVGVGRCRTISGGVMCPSFRATRDEKDSTRGRSRVLQEIVRSAQTIDEGWRSQEAHEALDLCLSCKACSVDCPVQVDMATYKSEFLSHFYRHRLRPVSHYSLGWLPRWLRFAGHFAPSLNLILASPLAKPIAVLGGITPKRRLPRLASHADLLQVIAAQRQRVDPTKTPDVVVVIDSFTKGFRPDVAGAAMRVLESAGKSVKCESNMCCALTYITTGQLSAAAKILKHSVSLLDDGTDRPIIVLEPSCAASLKNDLPQLVPTRAARRVAQRIHCFSSMVADLIDAGWRPEWRTGGPPQQVTVQTHCHEYAIFGPNSQRRVLRALGVTQVDEATGCCGVAGNFGFETRHFDLSMKVAQQALGPTLETTASSVPVLADGFSCRMQILQLDPQRHPLHLAELLDQSLSTPKARSAQEGE